jgi:hypothetical protein
MARPKALSEKQEKQLVKDYKTDKTATTLSLAAKYEIHNTTVSAILARRGVRRIKSLRLAERWKIEDGILKTDSRDQAKRKKRLVKSELVKQQKGKCAICKTKMKEPCVDHCHTTGKIRGALCVNCNTGLGHFCDSVELLKSAISYLKGPN